MFKSNASKDAPRPKPDRESRPVIREPLDDVLDPNFIPPRADQFRITDLQLWIDLSA